MTCKFDSHLEKQEAARFAVKMTFQESSVFLAYLHLQSYFKGEAGDTFKGTLAAFLLDHGTLLNAFTVSEK